MNRQPSLLDNLFEEPPRPVTVTELTADVKRLLERRFGEVWVEGEISNGRAWNSGHFYFTLKDAGAQIKGVVFRSTLRHLKFKPDDGLQVVARGRLSVYEPKGEYQLVCEHLEPKGLGACNSPSSSSSAGWQPRACSTRRASARFRPCRAVLEW